MTDHQLFHLDTLADRQDATGKRYFEFLRTAAMSGGLYVLPADGSDPQLPHREDELYVVLQGTAVLRVGDTDLPVTAGSVAFVAAEAVHRFHTVTEELRVLVLFAPAETG